jgi:hypothetical protein
MRGLANVHAPESLANRHRARRFKLFADLVGQLRLELGRPVSVLDVGGTNSFWEQRGWAGRGDVTITTANLAEQPRRHWNIAPRVCDATDLGEFGDLEFDVAFSNSVIEHLRTFEAQAAMASEVRRVAARYWVQTPNFWFPIEPHFLTPAWHWMPTGVRIALLRRHRFGWRGPCASPETARRMVEEVRLMQRRELARLFPEARLLEERFGPLVKSFVAFRD